MCLRWAISTCLLEKYFDRRIIRASLAGSEGWKAKIPKFNHLSEPFIAWLKKKRDNNNITEKIKMKTTTPLRLKKRQSIRLKKKKTPTDMASQIICLPKNRP